MIKYIVDGHNTINSIPNYINILENDYPTCIEKIIDDCELYSFKKNIKINLVFDGNPPFAIQNNNNISIFFSGKEKDADTLIIEQSQSGKNIIVITNDKDLRRHIVSLGSKYISTYEFYYLISLKIKNTSKSNEINSKKNGLNTHEVKWWKNEMLKEIEKKKNIP